MLIRHIVIALSLAALFASGDAYAGVSYIGPGSSATLFASPTDVELTQSGDLLVADYSQARVVKLDTAGNRQLTFNTSDPAGPYFTLRLGVGPANEIYAVREGLSAARYSDQGVFERSVGKVMFGEPGYPVSPKDLAVDGEGYVYVLSPDSGLGDKVAKFSPEGAYAGVWPVQDGLGAKRRARAIAARGKVVAVLSEAGEVVRYDQAGAVLSRFAVADNRQTSPPSYMNTLTVAPAGDILVAGGSFIQWFTADGSRRGTYEGNPTAAYQWWTAGSYNDPCLPPTPPPPPASATVPVFEGLTADVAGNVYAADSRNLRIVKLAPAPDPVLDWGPGGASPFTGEVMTFGAENSTVPFSSITKFEWDLDGDGTFEIDSGITPRVSHPYARPGLRTVKLRVSAANGRTATTTADLDVRGSTARVSSEPQSLTGQGVTFDAAATSILCGWPEKFEWDLDGDGTFETDTGKTPAATKVYTEPGDVAVKVRVTRAGGRVDEASTTQQIRLKPPTGPLGVTINDGAQFTNDPLVRVNATWPRFTERISIANDGGFSAPKSFLISESQPWRLSSAGSERVPRKVYVRFDSGEPQTFSDDIILDQTSPVLTRAGIADARGATVSRPRFVRLRVRVRDNLSGVSDMQFTPKRRRPGRWREMKRVSVVWTSADALWVRVRDKAGNKSRWKLAR